MAAARENKWKGLQGDGAGIASFPHLFSGLFLPPVHLKNRIVMVPLFTAYANPDGTVSNLVLAHHEEMAASGAAMVVVANASVDESGRLSQYALRVDEDRFMVGLSRLAETIKSAGAVPVLQINHGGRFARTKQGYAPSALPVSDMEIAGFLITLFRTTPIQDQWALASDVVRQGSNRPKEMDVQDIRDIISAYAHAAARARDAGFDMVEIHGGTAYLPMQFLSPRTNLRKDRYGGDLHGRMRFSLELVEEIKKAVGMDFPVGYRLMADEWMPKGFSMDESVQFAKELANRKIAYLSLTAGTYETLAIPEMARRYKEPCYLAEMAGRFKAVVEVPVIVSGRILTPQLAEGILERGEADLIGLARPLFADPLWVKKAREGENRVVPCKDCGTCYRSAVLDRPALCPQWQSGKTLKRKSMMRELRNPYNRILIAMDDSENAILGAIYAAQMLPRRKDLAITLLHIQTEESEVHRNRIQSVLEGAKGHLVEAGVSEDGITILIKKKREGVARDILEEITSGRFGTVVVGRRGVSKAEQFLFGSVSSKLLQNARDCTVWLVD